MNTAQLEALAQRLGEAEAEYRDAISSMDGSPEARMRLTRAREHYREAEHAAIESLGAREALALVEQLRAAPTMLRESAAA